MFRSELKLKQFCLDEAGIEVVSDEMGEIRQDDVFSACHRQASARLREHAWHASTGFNRTLISLLNPEGVVLR